MNTNETTQNTNENMEEYNTDNSLLKDYEEKEEVGRTAPSRNKIKSPTKPKKQKVKKVKAANGKNEMLIISIAGISALVLFVALLSIQKHLITKQNTTDVYVVKSEIVKGITITEQNLSNYFTLESRLTETIPSTAIKESSELIGKTTLKKLSKKEMLSENDFAPIDYYDGIEEPVVISLEVNDPVNAVSGTLRAGDIIDIKWMTPYLSNFVDQENISESENNSTTNVPPITVITTNDVQNTPPGTDEDSLDVSYLMSEENLHYSSQLPDDTSESQEENENTEDLVEKESSENDEKEALPTEESGVPAENADQTDISETKKNIPIFSNISNLKKDSYEKINDVYCVNLAKNIRVKDVFTAEAIRATADIDTSAADTTQTATMINIVIPRSMENTFIYASEEGVVKITKVASSTEGE